MITHFIEVCQPGKGFRNWGKFMVARFDEQEWKRESNVGGTSRTPLLNQVGWGPYHVLVLDLQTGEGGIFQPGGLASADLNKHRIWVCPMFEPFLTWLYRQDLTNLAALPAYVELIAEFELYGHRRPGPQPEPPGEPKARRKRSPRAA